MSNRQLSQQKKRLEDAFRRYGIEGEDAFYAVAYQYLICSGPTRHVASERIKAKGEKVLERAKGDKYLTSLLSAIIGSDRNRENLPVWYQHFLGRRFRESSGKFFTPHSIARAMAELLPVKDNAVIMDPACGGGTFLIEASKRWAGFSCLLVANDVESSLVDLTEAVLAMATPQNHEKYLLASNIYEPCASFREWFGKVDYILANPPFSLKINAIEVESRLFSLGYRNSDALFLDICFSLLRPNGRLVCLLPHSIVANADYQGLRAAVEESWNLLGVIGMPEGVFHLTASTTTRADIVMLEKFGPLSQPTRKTVFAFAPSVGVPLNSRMKNPGRNYLQEIVKDEEFIAALRIEENVLL